MKDENLEPWGPNKGAPGAYQRGSKGPKMAKIDPNLEFFFYFAPIQFTLAKIFTILLLILCRGKGRK